MNIGCWCWWSWYIWLWCFRKLFNWKEEKNEVFILCAVVVISFLIIRILSAPFFMPALNITFSTFLYSCLWFYVRNSMLFWHISRLVTNQPKYHFIFQLRLIFAGRLLLYLYTCTVELLKFQDSEKQIICVQTINEWSGSKRDGVL